MFVLQTGSPSLSYRRLPLLRRPADGSLCTVGGPVALNVLSLASSMHEPELVERALLGPSPRLALRRLIERVRTLVCGRGVVLNQPNWYSIKAPYSRLRSGQGH